MGRKKIKKENKKKVVSLYIKEELYEKLEEIELKNKSKFFSWLFEEYLNSISK